MRRNQKEFSLILAIIALGVIIIIAVISLSVQKRELLTLEKTGTQPTSPGMPAIQNADDLNTTASELDNTDLNILEKELNQLEADISSF